MHRRLLCGLAIAVCASLAVAHSDRPLAQGARTIRVVISVPAGGAIDVLMRVLADHIGRVNGQTVVIESKPGASGVIAAETVARAAPDGNTLLVNVPGMIVVPFLRKVSFDPITSFEPVCALVTSPQLLVVNSASPYRTLADLIAAARAKPGELSVGSVGPNTTQHLAIERLKRRAEVNLTYVPFQGGAPTINALLGSHVTAAMQNYSEIGAQLAAGKLRALATPSPRRIEPLPDLPTIAETYAGFAAEVWFGLVATGRTPPETVAQLIDWFGSALRTSEVRGKLVAQALYPNPLCGADFSAYLRQQTEDYAQAIREAGIKGE